MTPKVRRPLTLGLILLAAVVVATSGAPAGWAQAPSQNQATVDNPADGKVVVAGQQVAIDRATGKLRQPTPEEARALAAGLQKLLNRSTQGLQVRQHANGAMSVDLQGRFLAASVAKKDQSGKIAHMCATNAPAARTFLKADAAQKRSRQAKAVAQRRSSETPEVR